MVKRPEAKADVKADLKVRTTTAVVCILAALVAIPYGQGRNAPKITTPNEQFGKTSATTTSWSTTRSTSSTCRRWIGSPTA